MTDLAILTRELIALRDKASAAPWGPFTPLTKANCDFAIKAHEVSAHFLALQAENDQLEARVKHTQQWYAERWQWMQHWFRTSGKDLPIADQFWSIIANGTPDVNTPPTYQRQLNVALHRAEAVEAAYRELCEAEPVGWLNTDHMAVGPKKSSWYTIPLITRPSMPESGK